MSKVQPCLAYLDVELQNQKTVVSAKRFLLVDPSFLLWEWTFLMFEVVLPLLLVLNVKARDCALPP